MSALAPYSEAQESKETDGRRKNRHNEEILFLAGLIRDAGISDYCLHHVKDGGMNRDLPLTLNGKWYDIVYTAPDGEIFMIEIMRVKTARGPACTEEGIPCQKQKQSSL